MKRVWPSRIRGYSSATGSLTLSTISAVSQTSSAVSRIVAPAATYSSSGICEPSPGALLDVDLVPVLDELVDARSG